MRALTVTPALDGFRLAFTGPEGQFEPIATFPSLEAAHDAYRAAMAAGELVLTAPYCQIKEV